jgi:formate hydrogenlyase subunit 6/NADH:ubiquinone oxidoreductase subunit I
MTQPRRPFRDYLRNIWSGITSTFVGMRLTIGYFFRKPVTLRYPEQRPDIPDGHRGLHEYDEANCAFCQACSKACPVQCIHVEAIGRGKDSMITRYDIDYSRCLFCDLCTEFCPTHCILMGKQYDLAGTSREACVVHFARPKSEGEIKAHEVMLARKDAERKAKVAAAKETKQADDAPKDKEG